MIGFAYSYMNGMELKFTFTCILPLKFMYKIKGMVRGLEMLLLADHILGIEN
jgi:hypothetical protein